MPASRSFIRRTACRSLSAAVVLAAPMLAALVLSATPAGAQDYPHLGLYGMVRGDGYPLWDATGTLQTAALDEIARYHEVILDASPITPYRPDAVAALRARRPDISLLAYVAASIFYMGLTPDSLVNYNSRYIRTVRDLDGFLYNTRGGYFTLENVNLAKRDFLGRFVVAEALADLWNNVVLNSGLWNGIFVDVYCDGIGWMETPSESIDVRRAGYANFAAFDQAWKAGTDTLANRLRRIAGPSVVLIGNCAAGTKYASFNGWMRENFPYQNGGTWYTNMYNDPGGYFIDEMKFRAPTHDYIFSAVSGAALPYSANNTRKARFGLGTAALGSGFGVFGTSDRNATVYPYHAWWYDEYAVDLATGGSSAQMQHTGWLGQALGPAYQMIWVGSAPDACTNPGFETNVSSGWTFFHTVPSTLTRDTTDAALGSASAHVTVPTAGAVPWEITCTSLGSINVTAGLEYSATFWVRAATPRRARVAAGRATGGGEFTSRRFDLTTSWTQVQVTLVPPGSGAATLQFQLGGEAGDVWLDDVHFQPGVTSLYRRDFQNGIVLVNPSGSPLTVPLGNPYRKLLGTADPAVNDGSVVTDATVAASDALFLIGADRIPPAPVTNLRRIP